jgi:hypothetical protein
MSAIHSRPHVAVPRSTLVVAGPTVAPALHGAPQPVVA